MSNTTRKARRVFRRLGSGMEFIKQLFKPVAESARGLTKDILTKSLDYLGGLENVLENPDKLLNDKGKSVRLYDTMMLDDRVSGTLSLKKTMTLAVDGDFVAPTDEPADVEIRDWIADTLYHMKIKWWDVLANWHDAPQFGNKVGEKIFTMRDGKIVISTIRFMHSVFFDFGYDEYGDLDQLDIGRHEGGQHTVVKGEEEIFKKFSIFVYPYLKDGNYYGESDLKQIYALYYSKYQITRFRNTYLQNYGQPIPHVIWDKKITKPAEKDAMEDILQNLQDNMYIIQPGLRPKNLKDGSTSEKILGKFQIELIENKHGQGTDQYEKTIDQIDRQISRKLLVPDKMGFTNDKTGARNQSQEFFKLLKMVIRDMHGRLEDQANEIIKQLTDLNFPNVENYTEWKFKDISKTLETEMLKALIELGVVDKEEKWIRSYVNIPELTEDEKKEIEDRKAKEAAEEPPAPPTPPAKPQVPKGEIPEKEKLKVNYKKIERIYDESEADFVRDYNQIHRAESESVIRQVERKKIIPDKDLAAMKKLRVGKTEFKRLLSLYYAKLYIAGKASAIEEFQSGMKMVRMQQRPSFATAPPHTFLEGVDWLDRQWITSYLRQFGSAGKLNPDDVTYLKTLRDRAFFVTGDVEQRMLKAVHASVIEGIDAGLPDRTVITQIDKALAADRKKYAITIARTNAADAFNTGRMNFFMSDLARPFIEAYQYSAIIDNQTTLFCESHDGQIIRADSPQLGVIEPPNHFNCRSTMIPVMTGEGSVKGSDFYQYEEKMPVWNQGVPVAEQLPAKGFGGVA